MTTGAPAGSRYEREYAFGDREFNRLRDLVAGMTGIHLTDAKRDMTYGRVSKRLRALGLSDFGTYFDVVETGGEELEHFVNAITTNLTSFFRENHHFEYLATTALPDVMERNRAARRLRVWSAGCSTGEEPYSLAMVLREAAGTLSGWDARILATDLDSSVLARASRGNYAIDRVEGLDPRRRRAWFRKGSGTAAGRVQVSPDLQALIRFRRLNLMEAPWPMRGPFDVIFCRNVVIYFDKPTQKLLFDRYADILAPRGFLFVGHSESLFRVTDRFELVGKSIYRKTG